MKRTFRLSISEISVFKRFGDGFRGGDDDLAICGFGVNRNGQRYIIPPTYVPSKTDLVTTYGFRFEPPINLITEKIPYTENDFLFCLWLYERDNESLAAGWDGVTSNFNDLFDTRLGSLNELEYPDAQFQSFAEIMIDMHGVIKVYADSRILRIGDGDDIAFPFFVRAHHNGRSSQVPTLDALKELSQGRKIGQVKESGGTVNYNVTLNYSYSKVEDAIL